MFGEYSKVFAGPRGRLFHIDGENLPGDQKPLRPISELTLANQKSLGLAVFGFGQDAAGELYVLGNKSGVPPLTKKGATGVVMKLVPAGATGP